MQIEINLPDVGRVTWVLPADTVTQLESVNPGERAALLDWLQRQTEGFLIALMGTRGSKRRFRNLEAAVVGLVSELASETSVDSQ